MNMDPMIESNPVWLRLIAPREIILDIPMGIIDFISYSHLYFAEEQRLYGTYKDPT